MNKVINTAGLYHIAVAIIIKMTSESQAMLQYRMARFKSEKSS